MKIDENTQCLYLIQAMLGAISPNFRAISIVCNEAISLYFVLERHDADDIEEIHEIEFEFEAFQSGSVDVLTQIIISEQSISELKLPGRFVYLRKESCSI